MRVFISVELPKKIVDELCKIQDEIREIKLIDGKLIERENIHLTVKFLGEIDEDKLNKIKDKIKDIVFSKFDLELNSIGVFDKKYIRIVWIGVKGKELWGLQKEIDSCLSSLFPKEERFMGHITIARPKFVKNREEFLKKLKNIKLPELKFEVDKAFLKKSELSKSGPRYETLLEIKAT